VTATVSLHLVSSLRTDRAGAGRYVDPNPRSGRSWRAGPGYR
jgi:hypothetical protein